jgi:hypothetical protein
MRRMLGRIFGPRQALTARGDVDSRNTEDLRVELSRFGTWMYRFDLGDGVFTPLHDEVLAQVHDTRARMIYPQLDETFAGRWDMVTCLDAACNEGHFGFEVAGRGAQAVVGFDARQINIQKAEFVRARLAINNISFRVDDLFNVRPETYGTFDLTLCLGLLYHLEDPMGALRLLRSLTRELCVIDTQVLRASSSVSVDRGPREELVETNDVVAVLEEREWQWNPLASVTGISLVPNKSALVAMLRHAGFSEIRQIMPYSGAYERYANFDRVIMFARV